MLPISGFSKMSKNDKIRYLSESYLKKNDAHSRLIESFWHKEDSVQNIIDDFSENTVTNFVTPYGVVPNMLINEKLHCVPMAIEESSVVAACSKSAKFWMSRGGFNSKVISTDKIGHVHFLWEGDPLKLKDFFKTIKNDFFKETEYLVRNMKKRGGGISSISLLDKTSKMEHLYQIEGVFNTCDAMGANFINTILEAWGNILQKKINSCVDDEIKNFNLTIVMCILSNYTPDCLVKTSVRCPITKLSETNSRAEGYEFAKKFITAIDISRVDVFRATTHNKGIFNGIDAVSMATGNDSRAIEACAHAYAARSGEYRGLSKAYIEDDDFVFELTLPISVGTIGGLTSLHPLSKISLEMLGNPSASELMQIMSSIGLAQNFAAIRSLVTSGIQKGHMKMHLMNITNQIGATKKEKELAFEEFEDKTVSFSAVSDFIESIRKIQ